MPQKDTGTSPHQCQCPHRDQHNYSPEAIIIQNQLRWAGHCMRMPDNGFPRQVLFAQLTHVTRTRDGQRKRFKDTVKHYMKKGKIYINAWQLMAADRPLLCRSIYQKTAKFETNRLLHDAEKRQRIKEREMPQHLHASPFHLAPPVHIATRSVDQESGS